MSKAVAITSGIVAFALSCAGVYRLELSRIPADVAKLGPVSAGHCLSSVEISPGNVVTLGSFKNFDNAASAPESTGTVDSTLAVRTTGAVEVHLSSPVGAEKAEMPLAGETIVLNKASGPFELALRGQQALVRKGDALLSVPTGTRFGPADDAIYEVVVGKQSKAMAVVKDGKEIVPAGVELAELALKSVVAVVPLQATRGNVWLKNPTPSLSPLRVSGQPGLADISIETSRSNLRIAQGEATTVACALAQGPNADWVPAAVTQQPGAAGSLGHMSISLPALALPSDGSGPTPVWIAVATTDGQSIALGGIQFVGRYVAGAIATLLTIALLAPLMRFRGQRVSKAIAGSRWFAGLFLGPDGEPSLSLLQILIWTTITIWGFFYVFIVAGNLLALTPEMMSLLGIAGVGTVVSRWITTANGPTTTPVGPPSQKMTSDPSGNDFWKMLSTAGHFDLLKLQLFAFTVVIALYVVWRIADAAAFPVLDANTLLLLGVSQGVYVTGKLAASSDLSAVQATKGLLDINAAATAAATAEQTRLTQEQAALAALAAPSAQQQARIVALPAEIAAVTQTLASLAAEKAKLVQDYNAGLQKLSL